MAPALQPLAPTPAPASGSAVTEGTAVLTGLLSQLVGLLMTLSADAYVTRPAPAVSGSVGEHVRHLLDHVSALVALNPGVALTYDHRERGTSVEVDRAAALRQTLRLQAALGRTAAMGDVPIQVAACLRRGGDAASSWSSLSRELAFVISHTIHHQATIAVLLAWQGIDVPHRFGHAPTTPDRS